MKHLLAILVAVSTTACVRYEYVNLPDPNQGTAAENNVIITEVLKTQAQEITPQDYGILATRITNKMLDDTKSIYEKIPQPKIYVREIIKESPELPDGFYYANKTISEIVKNSKTFVIAPSQGEADYHLQSNVFEYTNPNTKAPLILFNMRLLNKNGEVINQWVESITQLSNDDRSWW